ncbi:phage major capsid protein [Streptomyces albogriseolus]|uniref:phage major capsid protein n=1 Tax=Streptomyces albogriseolus TaxID=1887 RepID=UPI00225BBADC|nr:phage major capsid protein [Streptomyces viridodiastaticus]MCX4622788.1 phage major capsid protein [Streptomyces viridodiastaticus]
MELSHPQAKIRLADITAELERLGEKKDLTQEDEQLFDELTREFAEVDAHRRKLERDAALERVRSAATSVGRPPAATAIAPGTSIGSGYDADPILNPDSVEDRRFRNPWDLSEVRTFGRSKGEVAQELRARALSAVEKMAGANDAVRAAGTAILERWDDADSRIAKLCLATSSPEYLRAWAKVASGRGHMIAPEEQKALERAMSLTDTAGGYLVPFQLDPTVIITANGSRNQIREAARTVVATGDVWNGVSSGAVAWSWDAEATEVSDDAPSFAQPSIPVYKAQGFVPISIEALEDEANVTQEVARLLSFGRDVLEAAAFVSGTGVGQPTGIVTALAGTASVVTPTTAETFAAADIYKLDGALPARYRTGASWLANRSVYNLVRQFDTNGGAQMWERIGADVPPQLLGRPALEAEDMDASFDPAAAGDNHLVVYGDFSNYVIADRVGMTVEFIPHLVGANRRPTGQRGWYAYYRVGADSVNDAAFRMLNVATAV